MKRSEATRRTALQRGKGGTIRANGTRRRGCLHRAGPRGGLPWTHIGRMCARETCSAVQSRYGAIARRGLVPALIRA